MTMLHSRNIQDVLEQGLRPVRTTNKSLLAVSLILPSGAPLSSYINPLKQSEISITQLKMYSLYAANALSGQFGKADEEDAGDDDKDDDEIDKDVVKVETDDNTIYLKTIKETSFSVVLVCEKNYPKQIIKLKLDNLVEAFEELKDYEYSQDD
ncbi:hypothetical protein BN7_3485 [Wickerhamomyces ciferrii]|uniref:Uncharacterized protein n=1 Tax=Wickerhamomyces ciferrii (strain ATCC 14091 / BCRC 22168 / CBS 111 / JCM 3599 / NBRC 0793 / NRRL Y-1031 F-60-10) TaxID=1206466 RepID=K0KFL7_WICCF|nr:uncharacterized protein BN7_3485 [Wickerhamomyces ciferrii]CCH43930.1 hypothetical protein BN7_3485 [Wickerhamomyces ciferrii]